MQFFSDIFHYDFLQRAILAALLASIVCGILGSYSVARRCSYMVGAVSHALIGGIGLARFCQTVLGIALFTPLCGSVLASVIVSLIITILTARQRNREDTILSAIWTSGVALGLCFIAAIPGYAEDLNSYLFGNILLISKEDLWMMLILDLCILPLSWMFHSRFLALCFNEEGLALRGISTFRVALLLNILTGLSVVILAQAVGTVMVLALMILPAASAYRLSKTMPSIMLLAGLFCFVSCLVGMAVSYTPDWPTGAIIILTSIIIYIISSLISLIITRAAIKKKPEL